MPVLKSLALFLVISCFLTAKAKAQNDIPEYKHVVIVMEENHGYHQVIGSVNAPYINNLAKSGVLFTDSHGIGHPSQPNYLVLFSGSTQGVTGDGCLAGSTPFKTPNLGAALVDKGFTFKGYAQNMPSVGYLGCTYLSSSITIGHLYARKHTPWVNWLGTGPNSIPATSSLPMTEFPKDFDKLPTVAIVVPDMDFDMHNIGFQGDASAIRRGDTWLKTHLGDYAEWAVKHNSLLIITFDEDDSSSANENKIPTIFYGAKLTPGEYHPRINHYNILHTLQSMYGLPLTDNVLAVPVSGFWTK